MCKKWQYLAQNDQKCILDVLQSLILSGEGSGWSLAGQRPVRSRAKWAKEQRFPSTFPSTRLCCGGVSSDIFSLCKALYRSPVSLHLRMSAARAEAQQDSQGVCNIPFLSRFFFLFFLYFFGFHTYTKREKMKLTHVENSRDREFSLTSVLKYPIRATHRCVLGPTPFKLSIFGSS